MLNELGGENAFYGQDKQGDDAPAANMGGQGNILGGHKGMSVQHDLSATVNGDSLVLQQP